MINLVNMCGIRFGLVSLDRENTKIWGNISANCTKILILFIFLKRTTKCHLLYGNLIVLFSFSLSLQEKRNKKIERANSSFQILDISVYISIIGYFVLILNISYTKAALTFFVSSENSQAFLISKLKYK